MFGEELEARIHRECQANVVAGEEMGIPIGITLRVVRRMIASYDLLSRMISSLG